MTTKTFIVTTEFYNGPILTPAGTELELTEVESRYLGHVLREKPALVEVVEIVEKPAAKTVARKSDAADGAN